MKNKILLIAIIAGISHSVMAQKLISKNGHINFFSHTAIEDIDADNNQAVSIFDPVSGNLQFSLLIKSFEFQKKLMQEHFNENYMESDIYPKATFNGKIEDISAVNFNTDGEYPVQVSGDMTIHGVTKKINTPGTITVKSGGVTATSKFIVLPEDYNIAIPDLVKDRIAKEIEVSVDVTYNSN